MVKTARLFPSKDTIEKRVKSSSPFERVPATATLRRDASPIRPHSARATSHEHAVIRHPNEDAMYYEPAINHINSPYLSKIGYRSRSNVNLKLSFDNKKIQKRVLFYSFIQIIF